jgi:hypothetical protein
LAVCAADATSPRGDLYNIVKACVTTVDHLQHHLMPVPKMFSITIQPIINQATYSSSGLLAAD